MLVLFSLPVIFRLRPLSRVLLFLTIFFCIVPNPAAAAPLRVGIPDLPPLAFVDAQGRPQGLFVELLDHIAAQESWQIEYLPRDMAELQKLAIDGKIDLIAAFAYSEERESFFDYTEQFAQLDWGVLICPSGNKLETLFELQGQEIAIVKGSIFTPELKHHLKEYYVTAQLVELDSYQKVAEAVASGQYPAGLLGNTPAQFFEKHHAIKRTPVIFEPIFNTFASGKRHRPDLLHAIDRHLVSLKNDPQSIYYQLHTKWLPDHPPYPAKYIYLGLALVTALLTLTWLAVSLRRQVKHKLDELVAVNHELQGSREELRRLNQQFQTLLDGIPDHLLLISPEMQVVWMNRAARLHLNDAKQLLEPLTCFRGWSQGNKPCDGCPVEACFESGEAQETVMQNGEIIFGIKAFPIVNEQGQVENVIKLAFNITDKIRLRENADRQNRLSAVGELSAGIAHEINNPTGLILSNLSTICEAFDDSAPLLDDHYRAHGDFTFGGLHFSRMREQLPAILKETVDAARRIRQIVEDLKSFARGDDGAQEVGDFHLLESVNRSVRLSELILRKSTLVFTLDPAQAPIVIHGCARRLEQVLVNLLANACQSLPDRNCAIGLTTRYDVDKQKAIIVIRDEGAGILPEHLSKLTTPFFTTRQGQGGTGLGLSVSFGIIKEHNGTIHFASEPGKGTTVTITLPAKIMEPTS